MATKSILGAKFLAIDTSILNKLARDWDSPQLSRRKRVRQFVDSTVERGILFFLTSHHVEELIRHENDHVWKSRLEFLSEFPILAWCAHYHGTSNVGNILDLNAFEIDAFERAAPDAERMRSYVKSRLIQMGTGQELVEQNRENWRAIRPLLIERVERERQIASLVHRPLFSESKGVTLAELLEQKIAPASETPRRLERIRSRVVEVLAEQADPDLKSLRDTADGLVQIIARDREAMINRGIHPFVAFLQDAGLNPDYMSPDMQIDELGLLAILASKLKEIFSYMGRGAVTFDVLRDGLLPSFHLWKDLFEKTGSLPKADGGNLADRYLTSFALYIDYVHVDKRTAEFVRQIRQHGQPWTKNLGHVFSAGTVDKFVKAIGSLAPL